MPRLPPVTSTVRGLPWAALSFVIVGCSTGVDLGTAPLLGLAVEDGLHRRQALDELVDRDGRRGAKLRREQVVHVQLLAGPAGALHVEPDRQRDGRGEAGRR